MGIKSNRPQRSARVALRLEALETRECPAVWATFNADASGGGRLTVTSDDASDRIEIRDSRSFFLLFANTSVSANGAPVYVTLYNRWGSFVGYTSTLYHTSYRPTSIYAWGYGGNDTMIYYQDGEPSAFPYVYLDGCDGDDYIQGSIGSQVLYGGRGNDTIYGGEDTDFLYGEYGNDYLNGGTGDDYLDGGTDEDVLCGWDGDDHLYGNAGRDTIYAGNGNDLLYGDLPYGVTNASDDSLFGEGGNDTLYGGAGNDMLDGGTDEDYLSGDDGNDTMYGNAGRDTLHGGDGYDTLYGDLDTSVPNAAADYLFGEGGDDRLFGGYGADYLDGGAGWDMLSAGGDADDQIHPGDQITQTTGFWQTYVGNGPAPWVEYGGGMRAVVVPPGGAAQSVPGLPGLDLTSKWQQQWPVIRNLITDKLNATGYFNSVNTLPDYVPTVTVSNAHNDGTVQLTMLLYDNSITGATNGFDLTWEVKFDAQFSFTVSTSGGQLVVTDVSTKVWNVRIDGTNFWGDVAVGVYDIFNAATGGNIGQFLANSVQGAADQYLTPEIQTLLNAVVTSANNSVPASLRPYMSGMTLTFDVTTRQIVLVFGESVPVLPPPEYVPLIIPLSGSDFS